MRVLRLTIAAVAALLSSACLVVSLQPVYEPDTIAFDPALLGTWIASDDDMTVSFERAEWHSYHVTIEERDDRTRLSARLTRVGEQLYLDVSPLDGADVAPLLLPVHGLYRLELDGDELSLADLNYEQLRTAGEGGHGRPADGRRRTQERGDHRQHGGVAPMAGGACGRRGPVCRADDLAAQGRPASPTPR